MKTVGEVTAGVSCGHCSLTIYDALQSSEKLELYELHHNNLLWRGRRPQPIRLQGLTDIAAMLCGMTGDLRAYVSLATARAYTARAHPEEGQSRPPPPNLSCASRVFLVPSRLSCVHAACVPRVP